MPEPLACIEDDPAFDGTMLILQKVNGTTLEAANLTSRGKKVFQTELAAAIGELHRHKADRFGPAVPEQTHDNWLDLFGPTAERTIEATRGMLPSSSREVLDHVARSGHLVPQGAEYSLTVCLVEVVGIRQFDDADDIAVRRAVDHMK